MIKDNKAVSDIEEYEKLEGWEQITLGQQLSNWAKNYSHRIAFVENSSEITYEELNKRVDDLAFGLLEIGIKKGDRVILQLPNRISFAETFFALVRIGAIPIMALPAHRENELDGICQAGAPTAYIIPDIYMKYEYEKLADLLKEKHSFLKYIIIDGYSDSYHMLKNIRGEKRELPKVDCNDTALLLLSGGTTGIPKLIPRTHADYAYNAKMAAIRSGFNKNTVNLAILPVSHNFPLANPGILGAMTFGGKTIMCCTTSPDEVFPLIEEYGATCMSLVPALVTLYMETLEWDKENDISSLQVVQVGGAMFEESLARNVMSVMGCKLQQVFGTAEGIVCMTKLEDDEDTICTCQGTPISEADVLKIVNAEGKEVPTGEYGELIMKGPYTIKGYYKAPEQNKLSFTADGYYKTGDKARFTKAGMLQMAGRIKEQINRAGEKITPAEIEKYLCKHPQIKEAAVVGISDKELGNRSCAFIITEDTEISLAEIHRFLSELGLARYKIPDQLERIEGWPLTNMGKIDKQKLVLSAEKAKGL